MKKDKIKRKDSRFFIIPLIALLILFAIGTSIIANINANENYKVIEKSTLDIAKSYTISFINSIDASYKITKLLDEKLLATAHAVISTENIKEDGVLEQLADKFHLDEINLYNEHGEITHSYLNMHVGWIAPENHPVYNFMKSDADYLVEDIRKDTVSENYYKYAYNKAKDNTFIQVGIIADSIQNLLQRFTTRELLDDIMNISDVQNVIFTDAYLNYTAAVQNDNIEKLMLDNHFIEHIDLSQARAETMEVDGNRILHVCAPVFLNDKKIGTLTIIWGTDFIDEKIQNIFIRSAITFSIVAVAVGIILYYAYRKDKSNFEIAFYDKLTGLPNKEYLKNYLEYKIKNAEYIKTGVLLLNCVNFRIVNLTYGFKFGDQTIERIANSIKSVENQNITLFRLDQDRFVFVVENYNGTHELTKLANQIIDSFNSIGDGEQKYEFITPEVAIYEIKDQSITVDGVMKYASLALNNIHRNLNEHIAIYSNEMEELVQRESKIEKAIRDIIHRKDKDSFYLVFQPKINIKTNKVVGFEALSRIKHEELGEISPVEFINIAEKRMLIYDLGNLILEKACAFLVELKEAGYPDVSVAVNISGIQLFRDDFCGAVGKIITSAGISPELLEFEITETIFMENFVIANERIKNINKLGISTSLDDFGTGYSSFAMLSELNIDSIKIDRQIINKITHRNDENMIAADIISMAHKMGLTVVAEGVEKEEQKIYLKENNCDIIQGYYYSKPLDKVNASVFIKTINESR